MKVLFAVHGYPPECGGGTELYVRKLAKALVGRGHEVRVVAGSLQWFHTDRVSEETVDGIPVRKIHRSDAFHERWDKSFCPAAANAFDEVLAKAKPDLVHVHHWMRLSRDLVEIARRRKVPAVVTLHDLWSTCLRLDRVLDGEVFCTRKLEPRGCAACVGGARPWTGPGEQREAARLFRDDVRNELLVARRRIVPTKSHGDRLAEALDLDPESFTVLPNGSIADLPRAKRRKPLEDGKLRIGHWGALYATKGVHVLLEAVHRSVHRDVMEVHLYGGTSDDAYGERLQQLAEGISVVFHGPFRANDLLAASFDVVALPSLAAESYSFALDEAMALGFPIVASDFGALGERLGSAGKLFPRGDRVALARLLDDFVERPGSLARMKAPKAPATLEEHVEKVEELYESAVAEGDPAKVSDFDERDHLTFEFQRSENRLRHALRYESLAHFTRDVVEDRENRVKMVEFLQAERDRLERTVAELTRRILEGAAGSGPKGGNGSASETPPGAP